MPRVVLREAALAAFADALRAPVDVPCTVHDDGDVVTVDGRGPQRIRVGPDLRDGDGVVLASDGPGVEVRLGDARCVARARFGGADVPVVVLPRDVDVFDRVRGVFETDALRDRSVAIIGCGSGGSAIARELAKAGVGRFVLIDHDRLEPGNVCRHECGLSDVGRLKVHAVADLIRDKNPSASVRSVPLRVEGSAIDALREAVADVDLVIGATDNRESRLLVNRVALQIDAPILFGAVFRRAYGGQVLRVLPGITPCYQCFLAALPAMGADTEIASAENAAAIAYSDRPVAIEPGLSSDIAPVALLMVKLAVVLLLEGRSTTLASLRDDLVAPLYLWLNRREPGTDYAQLPPLEHRVDDMTILRWYGVMLPRSPSCPACGSFEEALLARHGIEPADVDLSFFGGDGEKDL